MSFQYTPLAVIICLLLWKLQFDIFPQKIQNFPTIPKFSQNFHWLGVYNIKNNLARSCLQFWLPKLAQRVTKFRKTLSALGSNNYHLSIHVAFWKESMINRLSNLINRNRSAAKILQVLCSTAYPPVA